MLSRRAASASPAPRLRLHLRAPAGCIAGLTRPLADICALALPLLYPQPDPTTTEVWRATALGERATALRAETATFALSARSAAPAGRTTVKLLLQAGPSDPSEFNGRGVCAEDRHPTCEGHFLLFLPRSGKAHWPQRNLLSRVDTFRDRALALITQGDASIPSSSIPCFQLCSAICVCAQQVLKEHSQENSPCGPRKRKVACLACRRPPGATHSSGKVLRWE